MTKEAAVYKKPGHEWVKTETLRQIELFLGDLAWNKHGSEEGEDAYRLLSLIVTERLERQWVKA